MLVHLAWIGSRPPKTVLDAVDAARRAAAGCEVMFHADESAVRPEWLDAMNRMKVPPHMRSDIQRHEILRQHGGLWLDADVRILASPSRWAAAWDRYTAVRLHDRGSMVGTDIIGVPRGWSGWPAVEGYIDGIFQSPPTRPNALIFASRMILTLSRRNPDLFAILPPAGVYPFTADSMTAESVVARGFDPPPGLGDMIASGLASVGITKERAQRVARAVGLKDCGCGKRHRMANLLGAKYLGLPPGSQNDT